MPASAVRASVLPSVLDLLDLPSPFCPGCGERAARWRWVLWGGGKVLTHDGDAICPRDTSFGTSFCPGCGESAPGWRWVRWGEVLTHDGEAVCPRDRTFATVTHAPAEPADVCPDCKGTQTVIDDDGSVSGVAGAVIACVCSDPVIAFAAPGVAA